MDDWKPTHRLTFTPDSGPVAVYEVRLTDDGAAYERREWHGCWHACVEYGKDRGWTFYGQPTPGGQPGTVTVEEV